MFDFIIIAALAVVSVAGSAILYLEDVKSDLEADERILGRR